MRSSVRKFLWCAVAIFAVSFLLKGWVQPLVGPVLRRPIFLASGLVTFLAALTALLNVGRLRDGVDIENWRKVAAIVALIALSTFIVCSPNKKCNLDTWGRNWRVVCPADDAGLSL